MMDDFPERDHEPRAQVILRFGKTILFLVFALCLADGCWGMTMPSSLRFVFPFPGC